MNIKEEKTVRLLELYFKIRNELNNRIGNRRWMLR